MEMEEDNSSTEKPADVPAWYRRIRTHRWKGYPDFEMPRDIFDEDISELEEDEEDFECHCEAAKDLEYGCECYSEPDSISEMAYDGPDASEYYTLKGLREERKECLKKLEEQKQRELEIHRLNVESVRATYKALKKERRRRKEKKRKRKERRDKKG